VWLAHLRVGFAEKGRTGKAKSWMRREGSWREAGGKLEGSWMRREGRRGASLYHLSAPPGSQLTPLRAKFLFTFYFLACPKHKLQATAPKILQDFAHVAATYYRKLPFQCYFGKTRKLENAKSP
jgi:hypothetical protein